MIGWEFDELLPHIEDDLRTGAFERSKDMAEKKTEYRWVEPETVWFDDDGTKHVEPAHQEQGEYVAEASIPNYVIVLRNGKKHLIHSSDVVAIIS